jgi:bifunctional non-homologous end joining protein LigD
MTRVAGVTISHPDRLIYPDLNISKVQLARYYEEIGDWIVPQPLRSLNGLWNLVAVQPFD